MTRPHLCLLSLVLSTHLQRTDLRILRAGAPCVWAQLLGWLLSTGRAGEGGDVASEHETGCCRGDPKA